MPISDAAINHPLPPPQPIHVFPASAATVIHLSDEILSQRRRLASSAVGLISDGDPSIHEFLQALSRIWDWDWVWDVQRISSSSFLVSFPTVTKMQAICSSDATFLAESFAVKFRPWCHEVDGVVLRRPHAAWIEILGVPLDCRSLSTMKSILWGYASVLRLSSSSAEGEDLSAVQALVEVFAPNLLPSMDLILESSVHRLDLKIIDLLPDVPPPGATPSPILDERSRQFPIPEVTVKKATTSSTARIPARTPNRSQIQHVATHEHVTTKFDTLQDRASRQRG